MRSPRPLRRCQVSAPVNVLADLRKLANVGEYRDLRNAMESCLRPHEREGFAAVLGRMPAALAAVTALVEVADELADWVDGVLPGMDGEEGGNSKLAAMREALSCFGDGT